VDSYRDRRQAATEDWARAPVWEWVDAWPLYGVGNSVALTLLDTMNRTALVPGDIYEWGLAKHAAVRQDAGAVPAARRQAGAR
jgi:hypothetical protein